MTGILIVALLIGYLPTIYAAVQQREQTVAALKRRSGRRSPVRRSCCAMPARRDWRTWTRCGRTGATGSPRWRPVHNSLAGSIFVRAPEPERSWVTAAGAVLDAAALAVSTLDPPATRRGALHRHIGSAGVEHRSATACGWSPRDAPQKPGTAVSVTPSDFAAAYARLAAGELPVVSDRATAWTGFAQWRGRYDASLVTLARCDPIASADVARSPRGSRRGRPGGSDPWRSRGSGSTTVSLGGVAKWYRLRCLRDASGDPVPNGG